MPKKTHRLLDREFSEKCYFRWEFIRRNSTYLSDYEIFVANFASWFEDRGIKMREIHGFDRFLWVEFFDRVGPEQERYFAEKILPYIEAFHRKWGVLWPCDPQFSFPKDHLDPANNADGTFLDRFRNAPVVELTSDLQPNLALDILIAKSNDQELPEILGSAKKLDQEAAKQPLTDFRVLPRLGMRWNIERFFHFLRQIERTEVASRRILQKKGRQRFQECDQYLEVWDFKKKFPKSTWPAVARALYAEDYAQYEERRDRIDTNAVIQRAKDRYERAKELINGGFVEIR